MLEHTITAMAMRWELMDAMFVEDVTDGFEFGFALRRGTDGQDPAMLAGHLHLAWTALSERSVKRGEAERQIAHLRAMPGYAAASAALQLQRRVRRRLAKR